MSCEDLRSRADAAKREWLWAEQELMAARASMMDSEPSLTGDQIQDLELVLDRYARTGRQAIGATAIYQRAKEKQH